MAAIRRYTYTQNASISYVAKTDTAVGSFPLGGKINVFPTTMAEHEPFPYIFTLTFPFARALPLPPLNFNVPVACLRPAAHHVSRFFCMLNGTLYSGEAMGRFPLPLCLP